MAWPGWEGVMMGMPFSFSLILLAIIFVDTHYYGVFSQAEVSRSWDQQVQAACSKGDDVSSFHLWTIVGEWSLASTDCAKYLNGRGVGSRYDGTYPGSYYVGTCSSFTGSGANFGSDYKAFLRRFWEAQVTGQFSFCWKEFEHRLIACSFRTWKWLDLLDVESGECGRMELFCWSAVRMDSIRPNRTTVPKCLRMIWAFQGHSIQIPIVAFY